MCLFCSTLRVHSFLFIVLIICSLPGNAVTGQYLHISGKKTLHSAKLCRDFAKGLFLEFVGNVMQDFQFLTAMKSFRFLCTKIRFSRLAGVLRIPENFHWLFYCENKEKEVSFYFGGGRPKQGAARTSCLLFPSSSSAIYNSYCVMGGWYFGETPFAKINGTNNEQLMSMPLLRPEILWQTEEKAKRRQKRCWKAAG